MKLYGVSMVRNEADVLESWVRYHVQLFDRLVVADHQSIDSTPEILRQLVKEGLPMETTRLDRTDYDQASVITHLARDAVNSGADWVFPLDADEFLNSRCTAPHQVLAQVECGSPVALPWQTYVPTADDPAEVINPLLRITWRLRAESQRYDKVAIPADCIRDGARIGMGSHAVLHEGVALQPAAAPDGWAIAHFPVRSAEQLAKKVFVAWISVVATPDRGPRTAHQWKHWFDALIDADLSTLDPTELAVNYLNGREKREWPVALVRDPLPRELCQFKTRVLGRVVSPLKALAFAAESLAAELGRLRKQMPGSEDPGFRSNRGSGMVGPEAQGL